MITTENLLTARFGDFENALNQQILARGEVVEVEAGKVLLKTGEPIRSTMLVLDGRIKIYREDADGQEFLVYYLEAGSACALSMMCAMNQEKSQISAVAETESTLLSIPFEVTAGWMTEFRSWDEFILRNYRRRFEELLETLDHVAFRSMDERLLFYLQRKVEGTGPEIHISHQEIARDLNSAREVISRLLKKLEQKGVLTLERNVIRITDTDFKNLV